MERVMQKLYDIWVNSINNADPISFYLLTFPIQICTMKGELKCL
jgi:hypothetical protein